MTLHSSRGGYADTVVLLRDMGLCLGVDAGDEKGWGQGERTLREGHNHPALISDSNEDTCTDSQTSLLLRSPSELV